MPPAFNLSQDQTLEFNLAAFIAAQSSTRASRRKTRFECGRKPTFVGNLNCPRTPSLDSEERPSQQRRNAHSTRLNFGVKPPRKIFSKDFRKARFFPPRPRPFGQGPVKRKATYSTQEKTKSKPLGEKNAQISRSGRISPAKPAGKSCRFCRRRGRIDLEQRRTGCRPWPASARFGRLCEPLAPSRETDHPSLRPTCGVATIGTKRATKSKLAPTAERRQTATARKGMSDGRARRFCHAGSASGIGGLHGNRKRRSGRRAKRARRRLRACGRMQKGPRKRAFIGKPRDEP